MSHVDTMETLLSPLWVLSPPGPVNLYQHPAFLALEKHCVARFPAASVQFGRASALGDALRSLGLPYQCPAAPGDLRDASARLVEAFGAVSVTQRFLCPLDLADDLPPMAFGPARLRQFDKAELSNLFDTARLDRVFPSRPVEIGRLAALNWLLVEQATPVRKSIAERAFPFLHQNLRDFGAIDPHAGAHAAPVTKALFALLLFPWEDWVSNGLGDWRAFNVPWVHVENGDLFVRPRAVPSADLLTWEPLFDHEGEETGDERPVTIGLRDEAIPALQHLDHGLWQRLESALGTDLFSTPVRHFLVRGYFSEGMDEVIAHMTTVEAALGMKADFEGKPPAGVTKMKVTKRMTKRVEALTGDAQLAADYAVLFELRSTFIHGRSIHAKVTSEERTRARRVARTVASALVDAALGPAGQLPREDFLWSLG